MRRIFIILLLFCVVSGRVAAQSAETGKSSVPSVAIHLSSPLGLISKIGLKAEYRFTSHHSVLFQYNRYWGYYPGWQGIAQYRYYFRPTRHKNQLFVYGQSGYGQSEFNGNIGATLRQDGSTPTVPVISRDYCLFGVGSGVHWNLGVFFLEMSAGFKMVVMNSLPTDEYYEIGVFYMTGPGAIIDFHFNWGFQF